MEEAEVERRCLDMTGSGILQAELDTSMAFLTGAACVQCFAPFLLVIGALADCPRLVGIIMPNGRHYSMDPSNLNKVAHF